MADETPNYAWAEKLAKDKAAVLHLPTNYVGKAVRFTLDREVIQNTEVQTDALPILHFERGDTFHADDQEKFHRLSDKEAELFEAAEQVIAGSTAELATWAASRGVARPIFEKLVARALAQQVQALRAGK